MFSLIFILCLFIPPIVIKYLYVWIIKPKKKLNIHKAAIVIIYITVYLLFFKEWPNKILELLID